MNTVMNLWVPQNARKFWSSCKIGGFSRRAQLHEWWMSYQGHGRWCLSDKWQADCSLISWLSGNCPTGSAWRCASSSVAEIVVSAQQNSSVLWRRCRQWLKATSRKVDWVLRVSCIASLVVGYNSNGIFPMGTPQGPHLCSLC
jgi:hypothetical protein